MTLQQADAQPEDASAFSLLSRTGWRQLPGRFGGSLSDGQLRALWTAFWCERTLGLLPPIALVASIGLLIMAAADTASRLGWPAGPLLFWVGYLAILLPVTVRILSRAPARTERIALLLLVGLGLYLVKLLASPGSFVLFDEFLHWKTLDDILATRHLFAHNNVLPASPDYPGLEIATSAIVQAGGSIWTAGALVVGAGRILLVLSLFLFVERATSSSRVAGVAGLIYMANPSFLFFDAQFAYESLALPLAFFVLYCVLRRGESLWSGSTSMTVVILIGIASVVVTHHVTAILLAVFLSTSAIVTAVVNGLLARGNARTRRTPETSMHETGSWGGVDSGGLIGPALICITATVAWMLYLASVTVGYLAPAFAGALAQVVSLIQGEDSGRQLFRAASGVSAPIEDQLLGYASVAVLLGGLVLGAVALRRGWLQRPLAVCLALVGLAYPASLAGRFTPIGAELSARSSEFVFLGLGFMAAIGFLAVLDSPRLTKQGLRLTAAAVLVASAGGVVLGVPLWARLPGPYLVAADPRSVEPIGIDTATWMAARLGPENRIMTDRTNRLLTVTYGGQHPISGIGDQINIKPAYFDTVLTEDERQLLAQGHVRYVLVDLRLPTSLPYTGVYNEPGELETGNWISPMPAAALEKWDTMPGVDLIYDSGAIRIYDLLALLKGLR